jgi:purine nucleosidase
MSFETMQPNGSNARTIVDIITLLEGANILKVHLDTDLGGNSDDLCALAMLLKWPNVQIIGITTNTEKEAKRSGYTKYALQVAGIEDIPVKSGSDITSGYYRGQPGLPNESEYWPEAILSSPNPLDEALELLKASIEQDAIVIGIGSFTNFCLLDQKYPGILKKAKLFLMGGYIYPVREGYPQRGNDTDWNIQVDVNSAKYVLENSNPTLIPLSVTVETAIRRAYLPKLSQAGKLGEIMATQAAALNKEYDNEGKFGKICSGLPNDILNFQHDALACAIALGWNDGVEVKEVPLRFEIKETYLHEIPDENGKPTQVVTKVNGDKFNELWLSTVTS